MKHLGMEFRRAAHLHWRKFRPGDCGQLRYPPAWSNPAVYTDHCVIVKLSDCEAEDGSWDLDAVERAPAIPFTGWMGWNMVNGIWRQQNKPAQFWVGKRRQWFDAYFSRPVYLVNDGLVYRGTQRVWQLPKGAR